MNQHFLTIDIKDEASFLDACDWLHDATCELSNVRFDEELGTWTATFKRHFLQDPDLIERRPTLILFTRHAFPLAESVLSLANVESYEVHDRAQIDTFIFDECLPEKGTYCCTSCTGDELLLSFSPAPTRSLRDIRLLDERGSFVTYGRPKS